MDSEDERECKLTQGTLASRLCDRDFLELRFFERNEVKAANGLHSDDATCHKIARYRLLRFLASLEGFHTGALDLSGRHKARCLSLHKRLRRLMSDITSVANPNDSTMSMEERDRGIQQVLTTWNLAGAMSSVELLRLLAVAFKRATSQRPKLQSLVLLDLPPEILHLILDNEDETVARLFGATCRYLRNISQSYIFRNRNLTVHREFIDWTHAQTLGNEETIPYFNNTLERARNIVLQRADMIQNRPDIQKSVLHLTVHQNWNLFCMGHTSFSATFFTPIYKAVCETLPLLTSLRVLKMKNWVITIDLLHQLRFLTCLHTLEIKYCSSNLSLPIQAPQLASVLNVYFSFFFRVDMSSWIIISICSSIQNLSMVASDEENALPEISLPPPDIEATVNPFRTLRKLLVTYRDLDEVQTLTSSMRAARLQSSSGRIPLTHLKIGIEDGIYSGAMFDLIDTLSGSSLECLVLTGVINTEPDLLDRIARALPNLLELTLVGYTAVEMGSTEWTQTALEYAPYFSLFRRLRHFAWNNTHPGASYSPCSILSFEQEDFTLWHRDPDWDDLFDEGKFIAQRFWSQCPSLEYIVMVDGYPDDIYHRLEVDGKVFFEYTNDFSYMDRHNPSTDWDCPS